VPCLLHVAGHFEFNSLSTMFVVLVHKRLQDVLKSQWFPDCVVKHLCKVDASLGGLLDGCWSLQCRKAGCYEE